jgi:hypothetical protein
MSTKALGLHLVSLAILAGLALLAVGSSDSGSSGGSKHSSVTAGMDKHISGGDWFGCTDRDYFEKIARYAAQKDQTAFEKALTAGIAAGICTLFSDGETVYVADTAILSGLVKVRRPGEVVEYWTNLEAIN